MKDLEEVVSNAGGIIFKGKLIFRHFYCLGKKILQPFILC